MNPTLQSLYILNGKRWYFLSVFYAREQWAELILNIMNFYRSWTGIFSSYLFSFSGEYGEHLQVTFASTNENGDYTSIIQTYFQIFVDQHPSDSAIEFPYGKVLWCNYPNNSLTWNRFRLPEYSDQYISFHQQTMRTALKLMEDDFSEENIFSAGLYLFTKVLGCFDFDEQKDILLAIIHKTLTNNSYDKDITKKILSEIDINEACEAIESYKNENTNEYSPEIINWLEQVRNMLKTFNFNAICHFICKGLGLNGISHIVIVELLYKSL